MKFRVQWNRSGMRYGYEYRDSLKGALALANSKGFWSSQIPYQAGDSRPHSATIAAKVEDWDDFEPVAEVGPNGIKPLQFTQRDSVKRAAVRRDAAVVVIENARVLEAQIRRVAEDPAIALPVTGEAVAKAISGPLKGGWGPA